MKISKNSIMLLSVSLAGIVGCMTYLTIDTLSNIDISSIKISKDSFKYAIWILIPILCYPVMAFIIMQIDQYQRNKKEKTEQNEKVQ